MDVVSYYLSKTPMAMESECCSQGVVHSRPRVQVGSGEQAQQEGTDRTLTGPVQGCSLGTAVALRGATMALPGRSAAVGGGRQHGGVAEEGPAEQSRRDAAGPRQPSPQQHQRRHRSLLPKGTARRNRKLSQTHFCFRVAPSTALCTAQQRGSRL